MEEYIMFVNVKVQYYIIKNIYKLIYDRFDVISVKTRASLVHFLGSQTDLKTHAEMQAKARHWSQWVLELVAQQ